MADPIRNTLRADSPHRVLLYDREGNLAREEQRETLWDCQSKAVDHVRSLAPSPTGYRILVTNTEPDHFKLELQEDTLDGQIVGSPHRRLYVGFYVFLRMEARRAKGDCDARQGHFAPMTFAGGHAENL